MTTTHAEELDFIIVGQGLAGTLLTHFLLEKNQRVKVIDQPLPGASTAIAAGIVNPVTGRRIAKSWRFDELYAFAKQTYRELENLLEIPIWTDRNICRALHNTFEENEWDRRGSFPEYENFMLDKASLNTFEDKIKPSHAWGEMQCCAQVALPELINEYRRQLKESGLLVEEVFNYQKLVIGQQTVQYGSLSASWIIFCEGAKATENPFFKDLPFVPTKGELLLIKIPGAHFSKILKHHLFIVPLQKQAGQEEQLYWAGSTSRFEYETELPSAEQRQVLVEKLDQTLSVPYEIVDHLAGIRPTVFDIRPFLGIHHEHTALGIFNGLGTKGASLAPFFALQMANFLVDGSPLDPEVDIRRFYKTEG